MDIEIKVTITAPDGTVHTEDIVTLTKGADAIGEIGVSICNDLHLSGARNANIVIFRSN